MWTCIPSHSLSPFDRLCGGSLLSGLYNHAAAIPDLNGQFMVVEHGHAQQGVVFASSASMNLDCPSQDTVTP